MPIVSQRATASAMVSASSPSKNFSSYATFQTSTNPQRIGYVYFNRPFPLGATIASAHLELTIYKAISGNRNITVQRVNAGWQLSKVTHNNRPAGTGTLTQRLTGTSAAGRTISIDVTPQMQEVAAGGLWYGLRVWTDSALTTQFYGHKSVEHGPRLIVEYATAPSQPSGLTPANGLAVSVARPTLTFQYGSANASEMTGLQVSMNQDDPNKFPFDYISGELASTDPQFVVPFDIGFGEDWYWAVRVRNAAGEWSEFSDPAQFTRLAQSSVSITSPTGSPGVVTDPTPPFGWSFSGTQSLYRVIVERVSDDATLWDTRDVASTDQAVTYPETAPALKRDEVYRLTVRASDDQPRVATPGDPIHVEDSREFTFEFNLATPPPTDLEADLTDGDPRVGLTWSRDETPDAWLIIRDGQTVAQIPGPEAAQDGTDYRWTDLTAAGGSHAWEVAAIVNGVTSGGNPTATATSKIEGVWLMTLDHKFAARMAGDAPSLDAQEISTVHLPLGAKNPVLITQAVFGRRGKMQGLLAAWASRTVADEVAIWDGLANRDEYPRGTLMQLAWTDTSITVFIFNAYRDAGREHTESVPVVFDFCEVR